MADKDRVARLAPEATVQGRASEASSTEATPVEGTDRLSRPRGRFQSVKSMLRTLRRMTAKLERLDVRLAVQAQNVRLRLARRLASGKPFQPFSIDTGQLMPEKGKRRVRSR